jgi:integrase
VLKQVTDFLACLFVWKTARHDFGAAAGPVRIATGRTPPLDAGVDPAEEARKAGAAVEDAKTFKEVAETYLAAHQPSMKPRSFLETSRHLRAVWACFHKKLAHEITADMVADALADIGKQNGPAARNRARSSLSAMFAWAIGERISKQLRTNPAIGTNKVYEGEPRDRVLSDAELVAIWKAAPDNSYGRIIKLLMLTGQRREEIGRLEWSEVNEEKRQIELPPSRTKNSKPHDIPLSELSMGVLKCAPRIHGRTHIFGERGTGYSGWSRSKRGLDAASGVGVWKLHDLRRTAATRMADLGVQPHIIEAVLNHVSGHKAGVAGIYNRSAYAPEKRAALDVLASHISVLLARDEGANVTKLPKARA